MICDICKKDFYDNELTELSMHVEYKTKDRKKRKTKAKNLCLCQDCITQIIDIGLPTTIQFED